MTLYTKYPGNGYVYVICDVCGGKFHQKDTVLIKDSWNLQNNLVVCRKDVDKANAQLRPSTTYEKPVPYPEKLRPPQKDQYVSNSIAAQLPSAPQQLTATINPLNGYIDLNWLGPEDSGSGYIIGYQITRAEPQYAYQFTLNSNTNTSLTFYEDITSDITHFYTYQVAAINGYGVGAVSNLALFPSQNVSSTINYLTVSQTNFVLTTSSGIPIRLGDS